MPRHFSRTWCLRWCPSEAGYQHVLCMQYVNRWNSWSDMGLCRYFSEKHRSRNGIHHDWKRAPACRQDGHEVSWAKRRPLPLPSELEAQHEHARSEKPKTESSIRRVFIPATVAHQLKAWKREQEHAKEALGEWVHRLQPDPRQWSGSSDGTDAHHCTFERVEKSLIYKKQLFPASIRRFWRKSPRTRTC